MINKQNKDIYVTIVGFKHYYDMKPFEIGNIIKCAKQPENGYDNEAIRAFLPIIGTVGYIGNSPNTMARGTMSAGRIYDRIQDKFYVKVMFTTNSKVICKIEHDGENKELYKKMKEQMEDEDDDI